MAVLLLRVDVPGADPDTDIDQVVTPIVNVFNAHLAATGRPEQQIGNAVLEATWED